MLQKNDLRIGNFIMTGYDIDVVTDVMNHCVCTKKCTENYSKIKGIELTPDVIRKCGAIKDETLDVFELNLKKNTQLSLIKKQSNFLVTVKGAFGIVPLKHIEHLHHLQNLYFALTNVELDVTL